MTLPFVLFSLTPLSAQSASSPAGGKGPEAVPAFSPTNEAEITSAREQVFKLLRMTPKLTSAVAIDPSLLGDQEYVNRGNPELARFLQAHPEIVRNPEFYLFAHLPGANIRDNRYLLMQRALWPETRGGGSELLERQLVPLLVFVILLIAVLWLLRAFLENRRWGRLYKVQTDVHNNLLDKFGGSQ
jgi:hypothetical protein